MKLFARRVGSGVLGTAVVLVTLAQAAAADLLAKGQVWREIPFQVLDQKPMIAAKVGDSVGRMMFDTGTPEVVFLNRDALRLPDGTMVGQGFAASGQAIKVQVHDAPMVEIGGQPLALAPVALSGDFGFVMEVYGADYLGFIGMPAVESGAFVLDHGRRVLTVLRTDAEGVLGVPPPGDDEVVAQMTVSLIPGEQPTTGAFIGSLPIVLDFDTGDSGTLYLRPETLARLQTEGGMIASGDAAVLASVTFGGATFNDLSVRLVEAGGPEDKRPWPGSDVLRLGAAFLSVHPSLWNMPARTLTILSPDTAFLAAR